MSDLTEETSVPEDAGFLADDPAPEAGRKWETVFADNGDIVEWLPGSGNKRDNTYKPGTIMEGTYIGSELIELSEEDRLQSEDPDKTHTPLLVFEDEYGDRWSTWETYQIKEDRFKPGDFYMIECQRERKVGRGSMKSFKILRDSNGTSH